MGYELVFDCGVVVSASVVGEGAGDGTDAGGGEGFDGALAGVCGVRNAGDGALVDVVVEVLDGELWRVAGVHTPVQWLMWRAGVSRSTARRVLTVAARAAELPYTVGLLREGSLSLDQAYAVARYTPGGFDVSVGEFARLATVGQIVSATRRYNFDVEAKPLEPEHPDAAPSRSMSFGFDDDGMWWANVRLAASEGAVVEAALRKTRDVLHHDARDAAKRAARAEGRSTSGTDSELGVETPGWADCLVGMANNAVDSGVSNAAKAARAAVHLYLEVPEAGCEQAWIGELHGGVGLPGWLRDELTCDADISVVWSKSGTVFSEGRSRRTPSDKLRRVVEHRDRYQCRVPGCTSRRWLHLHHIVHWVDGGETTSRNLLCLCPKHHRQHHQGALGITGDADLAAGESGAVVFTGIHGLPIQGVGPVVTPGPGDMPRVGAYEHPLGERLQQRWVHFTPDTPDPSETDTGGDQHRQPAA